MDVTTLTISSIQAGLRSKRFSAVELAQESLRFAQAENPKTNAYLRFSGDRALATAKRVDDQLAAGADPGPLAAVPVVIDTEAGPVVIGGDVAVWFGELDEPTTGGQRLVRDLQPDQVWLSHEHAAWRPSSA